MTTSISLSSSSLGAQKQNKKDNDKRQLVIVFFGCIETKQKKTATSTNSLSSFFNAQKQNKKR
jgi:hypothetical protein